MTHGLGGSSVPFPFPFSSFSPFNPSFSPSAAWTALNRALCFALIKDWPLLYAAQSPYLVNRVLYFVTARLRSVFSQALIIKENQDSDQLFLYLYRFPFFLFHLSIFCSHYGLYKSVLQDHLTHQGQVLRFQNRSVWKHLALIATTPLNSSPNDSNTNDQTMQFVAMG